MRLYQSAMAYVLVSGLGRLGLKETELAQAQVSAIRTKLLKVGPQIRVTVRKVWVPMAFSYPWLSASLGEPALLESGAQANAILEVKKPTAGPVEPRAKSKTK